MNGMGCFWGLSQSVWFAQGVGLSLRHPTSPGNLNGPFPRLPKWALSRGPPPVKDYALLSTSNGLSRAARRAGHQLASTAKPTDPKQAPPRTTASNFTGMDSR